ncbi:MAG TPA: hypothetical protein IAB55_12310 [Candidatus Merdivicinus faecavium]|nr:hypothetical protein [Candidatus Merdivicinus faecavium]
MQGDAELNYAYYALHELKIPPGAFAALSRREKAVVTAFIDIRVQERERLLRQMGMQAV